MNVKVFLLFVMNIGLLSSQVYGMDSDDISETPQDPLKRSELHDAAFAGDEKTLLYLLNRYVDDADMVNMQDLQGRTALHYAVKSGSTACVAILLKSEANPNVTDYAQVCDRVKANGVNRSECNSPLDFAVKQGRVKIVELLLNAPSIKTKTVHWALARGLKARDRTVRSNKDKKSNAAYVNQDSTCNDLYNGIDDCCYALLQHSKFSQKHPELRQQYHAVYRGDSVLEDGDDYKFEYPLHAAARDGDLNGFKQSLLVCHQINSPDDKGKSLLYYAAQSFNDELTKLIFRAGAQPSQDEKNELLRIVTHQVPRTSMYVEKINQFSESRKNIIELLITHGADVNAVMDLDTGRTLLHEAVLHKDVAAIKFLLKHKANTHLADDCGLTPIDLAHLLQNQEVVETFDDHSSSSHVLTANTAITNLVSPRNRRVSAGEKIECYDQPEKAKRRRSSN